MKQLAGFFNHFLSNPRSHGKNGIVGVQDSFEIKRIKRIETHGHSISFFYVFLNGKNHVRREGECTCSPLNCQ